MDFIRNKNGFTLLELILALVIVGFIVALSLSGIRLGISAQEAGDVKVDTFQRLRVIGEQLSQKIKSNYPVFIPPAKDEFGFTTPADQQEKSMLLAFEGEPDSIRFITFSPPLTAEDSHPWAHEVRFYLGNHPDTGEKGILMMERDITDRDLFTKVSGNSEDARFLMLAREVGYLKFRYYQMRKIPPEELEGLENPENTYEGKWVDSVTAKPPDISGQLVDEQNKILEFDKKNRITLPRAVEMSLGLKEPLLPGRKDEPRKVIYSPPVNILIHAGMEFALPAKEEKNDAT